MPTFAERQKTPVSKACLVFAVLRKRGPKPLKHAKACLRCKSYVHILNTCIHRYITHTNMPAYKQETNKRTKKHRANVYMYIGVCRGLDLFYRYVHVSSIIHWQAHLKARTNTYVHFCGRIHTRRHVFECKSSNPCTYAHTLHSLHVRTPCINRICRAAGKA